MNTTNHQTGKDQMLLDAVALPVLISRLSDSTILYANPALFQSGHYTAEQLIGSRTTDYFVNLEDREKVVEVLNQQGHLSDFETQLRRGDGALYWALVSSHMIDYDDQVCVLSSYTDITERKHSEERLKAIYEGTNDAVMLLNDKGFFDCNPRTLEVFGFKTREDFISVHPSDVSPEFQADGRDSVSASKERMETAYREGHIRFEWIHRRANGEDFPAEVLLSPLDLGGQKVLQATVRDITERKLAEQKLNESEERYHRLSEASVEGVVIHDKGILLDANEVFATMFGYEHAEVIGMKAGEFLTPETRGITAEHIRTGYEKPYEVMGLRKDGSTFPVEITGKQIPYQGRMVRVTALRDITERKQAEVDLLLRDRALFSSPGAVFIISPDFKPIYANEAFLKMTGYTYEEAMQLSPRNISGQPEGVTRIDEAMAAQGFFTGEELVTRKDGSVFPTSFSVSYIKNAQGQPIASQVSFFDITERKHLEGEIQTAFERRGRQVQVSTQVAQAIASATSLEDLYQRVVTQVKEQFGYYHTQLLRYEAAQDAVVLVRGYGQVGERMLATGHRLPMGQGLIGTAAETGESVLRPTLENDPDWQPHPLLPNTKGEIAVPIKLGDKILGVLDVQSNAAGALGADDQLLLEGLCGQIAVAIESTRLSQEMAERLKEINRLYQAMSREGWQSYWQTTDVPVGFMYDQGGLREVKDTLAAEQFVRVPLALPGGGEIGSLAIADDPQRPISAEDKDFVQQVSEQVALALESARLFEQTQSALASTQDSETKLSEALDVAREALDIAKLAHWEYDFDKDLFTFNDQFYAIFRTTAEKVGGYQLSSAQYTQLFVHPDDAAVVGNEIGKAIASTERHFTAKLEHRVNFADGSTGYIAVEVHLERDENGKIIRWYGANQDITERRMAEEMIAKRAKDLAAVSEISSASTKELDIEKLLETVVHLTQRKFGLYHAHVFTFNEVTANLEIRACGWKEGDEHEGTHGTTTIALSQEQSLVARAGRTRQPVIVNDVHTEPGWLPNQLLPDTQSEMAVPMVIGDQLLGVLDVQSDKLNAFSTEDASIHTTLASQIATALQNARSFEQAQRQAEREAMLNIIGQKIQSATTVEAVLQIAARELGRALGAPLTVAQLDASMKTNGNEN